MKYDSPDQFIGIDAVVECLESALDTAGCRTRPRAANHVVEQQCRLNMNFERFGQSEENAPDLKDECDSFDIS